ncbi:hypothetical protein CDAR_542391 [Caerostris darwini]|uniref:Uncharacterized protein n=1 Tax=Caerostris darwini TaxID=1538125 RepID=A0AAV4P168_9ARAC|nr:hypothetical protein CDAR_542391 [Caerostris darwini]
MDLSYSVCLVNTNGENLSLTPNNECVVSLFNLCHFVRRSTDGQRMVYSRRGKRPKTVTVLKWTCDNIYERIKISILIGRLCRRNQPLTHKKIHRKDKECRLLESQG